MRKKSGVRISQCMIVKNEEENIERALTWGKDLMYEQIVVDTGSTDRTVELAEKLGAKVYHFEWINDFAAAKNYALSKARGEWIAFLDADEYFPPEDAKKLVPMVEKLNLTSYYVLLTSMMHLDLDGKIFAGGVQTRIFKRVPGLKYHSAIHEELYLNCQGIFPYTYDASQELTIFHTGYGKGEAMDIEKGNRNADLIRKELEKKPDDYRMMGFLGDALYKAGCDTKEAEEWFRKAIDKMPETIDEYDERSAATFWKLLSILGEKEDETGMMEIYEKAVSKLPKDADFDFVVGRYFAMTKNYQKGAVHLERAIRKLEEYGMLNRGLMISGELPGTWELLALCHYQNDNLNQCVECCVNLLSSSPYVKSSLTILLFAFEKAGLEEAQVLDFLGKLYCLDERRDRVFLLRTATQADYRGLVKKLRELCSQEELEAFDRAVENQDQKTESV